MNAILEYFNKNGDLIFYIIKVLLWVGIVVNSLNGKTQESIEMLLFLVVFELMEINSKLPAKKDSQNENN